MGDLLTRIDAATLPPRTLAALVLYHEQRAASLAPGRRCPVPVLEATGNAPEALAIGRGFYLRLQVLSPETLAAGGLPTDEVAAGFAELGRRG